MQAAELESVLSALLGSNAISIERIGGGRNSRVWKVTCGSAIQYTAKLYFHSETDARDRQAVEFSSSRFLWENGVRCIPQPIAEDREYGCAVYEYIVGERISADEIASADVDYAVRFLATLKELKNRKGSDALSPASEACFSVRAILDNIDLRLSGLTALRDAEAPHGALREFLDCDFKPCYEAVRGWCKSNLDQTGMSSEAELPREERTLSPSDFGFHNALRRDSGEIVFLDFEYFGWDDPAKMVADVLLHPGMRLSRDLKRRFSNEILGCFSEYPRLAGRVALVYPLFGLKWCLILLNEFLPEQLLRRRFAGSDSLPQTDVRMIQLAKAKRMLDVVMEEYEHFPYY